MLPAALPHVDQGEALHHVTVRECNIGRMLCCEFDWSGGVDRVGDMSGVMEAKHAVGVIGMHELEEHTREVLRRVREDSELIDVTDGATVIARIVPAVKSVDQEALAEWWQRHDELVEEINRHGPEGVSAADANHLISRRWVARRSPIL